MIQRGPIVLIVGGVLFVAGIIIAAVWAIQSASTFASAFLQERNILINQVSIEPGRSVEARTQVTDISRPITVAIHIQRLGERGAAEVEGLQQRLQQQLQVPQEQRVARLIETVKDPSGTIVNSNEFSANLFTTFQPQNTGSHILNITNAGARNVTVYGIFGYMPLLTAASSLEERGQPLSRVDLSSLSLFIVGGVLTTIGFFTIIAGIIIVVIDSRKRGEQKSDSSSGVTEGGFTYRKD